MKFIFVYVKMKKKIIESNLMSSLVRNIYKLKKKFIKFQFLIIIYVNKVNIIFLFYINNLLVFNKL